MDEIDNKKILENLNQELEKARQEIISIRRDHFPPKQAEDSVSEMKLQLKAKSEVIENLRNYHQICKKFAEDRIPTETPIVNKSEFVEIIESDSPTDGHSFQVVKKVLPEQKDMDIIVKRGVVSRGRY